MHIDTAEVCSIRSDNRVLKGKSAIAVARQYGGKKKNFNGERFWARGYAVSTVGFELEKVKEYIAHQERLDKDDDEGNF